MPTPTAPTALPADRPVRWGILSTGAIATTFVRDLALLPDCSVTAVGARTQDSADAFAREHGVARAYGDYRSMVEDPDVDVVYVATPHALHREHVELALDAGKAVLCEKAFTLTAAEAEHLVARARAEGLFLMEAMWMRCLPTVRRLQEALASGALGEVRQLRADLGMRVDRPPTDRLLDPALGGGALMDLGVYPLSLAQLVLGEPSQVAATASLSPAGVDLDVAVALGYPGGATASVSMSLTSFTPRTASIATDRGRVDLPAPFHHPETVTWTPGTPETLETDRAAGPEEIGEPPIGRGYAHEALEVVRCLRSGETESPLVPLDDTVALMRLTDRIREQIGVRYPADGPADDPADDAADGPADGAADERA